MKKSILATALLCGLFAQAAQAEDVKIAKQTLNEALRARLPAEIISAGKITDVNSGSFPPYQIINGKEVTGASSDMTDALGQLLGIKIEHAAVSGLSSVLSGISAGRYQLSFGPNGDFPSRQQTSDFVDWVREYVVFAVKNGNPEGITSLDTACGKRIAVMAGGSAEKVIKEQNEKCTAAGNPIEVQSYNDQPSSILAVRSNRADAFFSSQAPLTYYVRQSKGQLELSGTGQSNGFDDLYQGAVLPKNSPLAEVLRDGIQILIDNGTYAAIMQKWGLEKNMIDKAGINLAGKSAK
ncbi:ABC transporter substrate-binding protein [Pseudochrobactrum sp. HB0163]|uniref:ABC transporter substrate-binding protein n=1 Tax=Pseudochrobactrum sp. HB0163 TaxID=3450708 RepID=UPI003F6DB714